ncbi:MAG: tetratricopeptide repeat protein [Candidatus Solibacter sp.]|nr:tetratricopeptide repeat protein [Candidatus Solibacter sp.]
MEDSESVRLNSWKEIAAHLGVSVRTAERREKTEQLPARRHRHAALSSGFAYRSELDAWWDNRPRLREPGPESASAPPSIAVLPFANLDRDEQNEIFSDGLTEELINALAQVEGLQVVARTSVFHFKGKTGDARAIGARLGARTLVEGSVRRADDRLRITAQLINAADGCHLWSQRFDRRAGDVFEIQEEIAQSIVAALRVKLTGHTLIRQHGRDFEAFALYLEGRYHWNKRTGQGISKAIECFERALARDATMAPAWTGLADCYSMMAAIFGMPTGDALQKARIAAQNALKIDETLAEAHSSLACLSAIHDYNWRGAEASFLRVFALNPNHAYAHVLYAALVLGPNGRHAEAHAHMRRARELDPISTVVFGAEGAECVMLRRYDEAIAACRRALELDPGYPWAHRWRGEVCLLQGRYDEAISSFSNIDSPAFAAGMLGYCHAQSGRAPEARRLLQQLENMGSPRLSCQIAVLHLGLGEHDAAFDWLHKACSAHNLGIHWLKVEPIWDVLRPDQRFTDVLKRMDLAD